ncbi:General transcription factor 3C polypeptide 3 like protein [Argiope bruennichi]|uniref:General transcription factor 3C polypeptide 3 like protein n=1 Tax=Argiope bruennichi TaxID=94029 RepID=A0A8T0FTU2_ARGBR|nr:General transcription factor 3C polypeptide 3 like protein [Argiope bruennichi]
MSAAVNMDYDPMEGTSELFAALTRDVPQEQWEQYKEEIKLGNYIVNDSDDGSYFTDRSISPGPDEEIITNIEIVEEDEEQPEVKEEEEEGEEKVFESEEDDDQILWGYDAADKYAQGKISIFQLTDIMKNIKLNTQPSKRRRLDEEINEPNPELEKENEVVENTTQKAKRKIRRKKNLLPKSLEGLMGQANLLYAKGETRCAITVCMELIKSAPQAYEPFQLLGIIYDEMGESKKAFQWYLVAAFLNPSDTDEWIRLAELSLEQNEIQQAIGCYTRAIRNVPTNVNLWWERCNLYEQVGERKRALYGYEMILKHLSDPKSGEKCVDMAREIAKIHHENTDDANAVRVLETSFNKFPSLITSEDVNFLLELQLGQKMYKAAVKTFVQHCGVRLRFPLGDITSVEDLKDFDDKNYKFLVSCVVPEVLPIDLTVKFLLCLIHLQAFKAAQPLIDYLMQENPEEMGDLFLDVAEALMEVQQYKSAKPLLFALISTPTYDLPAVWMKYADCWYGLSNIPEAIQAYLKVIEMAPAYQDARLALSKIYLKMGKVEDATNILRQDYEDGEEGVVVGIDALYQRCKLLEAEGCWDQYIAAATLLQYSHCYHLETEEEFSAVITNQTCKRRVEALRDLKNQNKKSTPQFIGQAIPVTEMWNIFKKVCMLLMQRRRYEELQNLSLACLSSASFMKNPAFAKDLEFQALLSCYYNGSHQYTYLLVRDLVLKYLHSNKAWNLFCLIVTCSQENRHNRFCIRLMMKHQDHLALGYLNGHNAMISGTYKHALGEYMCILKEHPNDPFAVFCVGITFIHMACQKFATKRHFLTIQGFEFLVRYAKMKGENQETFYNIGRALHQCGIKDAAIHYYKKALNCPPLITGPEQDIFDLRREIAYNLCVIYQASGAMDLVSMYSRKYIVV